MSGRDRKVQAKGHPLATGPMSGRISTEARSGGARVPYEKKAYARHAVTPPVRIRESGEIGSEVRCDKELRAPRRRKKLAHCLARTFSWLLGPRILGTFHLRTNSCDHGDELSLE